MPLNTERKKELNRNVVAQEDVTILITSTIGINYKQN